MDSPTPVRAELLTDCAVHEFPALRSLEFSESELAALRRQGFLSREERRAERILIHKLRYRVGGRQRSRYLGRDPLFIEIIRNEVARLQAGVKRKRKMGQLLRQVGRALRRAKATLAPLLPAEGCHYHGLAIRQRRKTGISVDSQF